MERAGNSSKMGNGAAGPLDGGKLREYFGSHQPHLPGWVKFWLFFSGIVCTMDALFCILRPRTFPDGDLYPYNPLWKGWHMYMEVDRRYADPSDPVTFNIGRLNLVEVALNFIALYLAFFVHNPPGAPDYHSHNSNRDVFLYLWLPNCVWILIPILVMISLAPQLNRSSEATITSVVTKKDA